MKKLLPGSMFTFVMIALGTWVFLRSGFFPIAASSKPDVLDDLAPQMRDHAIARHARAVTSLPGTAGPESIARGLTHYRENCMPCHGAPDGSAAEFSAGLNPGPPPLEIEKVQARSDTELFWIVKNGLRMTGMPAFNVNHKDDEIADIVRFVRHLPQLTAEEKALLSAPPAGDNHHHH